MSKLLAEQVYESRPAVEDPFPSALVEYGEYTIYPMATCGEEEVAVLFAKVCQRGNPVLQGRPFKDLETLGKAMYRKTAKLGLGQVTKHDGKVVGLGFSWDVAEGGVWVGSGLEIPASLAAHAACGKACFDALPKRGRNTHFCAFAGMLPPHKSHCFGFMAVSQMALGKAMGMDDSFQFTLLPSLNGKGVFADNKSNDDSMNWVMNFTDVASDKPEVIQELKELDGTISLQLTSIDYNLSDEYMKMAAATVRLKTGEEFRRPMEVLTANHLKWLQSNHSRWSQYAAPGNNQLSSRL